MKTHAYSVVFAAALMIVAGTTTGAQDQSGAIEKGAAAAQQARNNYLASVVPLKVTIVLSKYQGEKKVSSLPYELTVRTDGSKSSIRMGTQVPVPGFGAPVPPTPPTPPVAGGPKPAPRIGPFSLREVGTNIDCTATSLDNGRFAVTVTIEDSSIYEDTQKRTDGSGSKVEGVAAVRTFRTTNALVLRDGQSTEFTTAVDKVNGDVIKAAVTMTIIK
jgi:hypothetical protein